MLDRVMGGLAVAMCFLFGHIYNRPSFKGKFVSVGLAVPSIVPLIEMEKLPACPRCGKTFTPRHKAEKGDNRE